MVASFVMCVPSVCENAYVVLFWFRHSLVFIVFVGFEFGYCGFMRVRVLFIDTTLNSTTFSNWNNI
jgi:hypothetical protein